jgi:2-polyprenyl-3-methyl-5-hydroxy-6-metoxy-1,4-benzoquinol methylase
LTDEQKVKKHFEKSIADFDLIYVDEKSWFRKFLDRRLRYDNYERYELTLQECADINGKRILDIGCGSGRYSVDLAKLGAGRVVGIDFAQSAVDIASKLAKNDGVSNVCSFISADFKDCKFDDPFHISLAIGVMDYVFDPVDLISKMRETTTEKLIMSFPSKSTYRMAIRKTRYWIRGCPLFFYNRDDIQRIFTKVGIPDYTITKLSGCDNSGDFFVVARLTQNG